jgi:hypothetical protein
MKFRGAGGTHLGAGGVQGRSPAYTGLFNFTSKFMNPLAFSSEIGGTYMGANSPCTDLLNFVLKLILPEFC